MTELKIDNLKIDPKIFTFKFSCRCSGECCNYGVYTDSKEAENILSIKDKIIPLLDDSQSKYVSEWFEAPEKDDDFESGIAVGTQIINDKCTFLDKSGLCTLQKLALLEGEHKWKYKPLYCYLFPLTIFEGALTIDDEHIDRLKTCNKNSESHITIFEACKDELHFFFGDQNFAKLLQLRNEYLNEIKVEIKDESI
jgi:Fe-S-cluster containining protein